MIVNAFKLIINSVPSVGGIWDAQLWLTGFRTSFYNALDTVEGGGYVHRAGLVDAKSCLSCDTDSQSKSDRHGDCNASAADLWLTGFRTSFCNALDTVEGGGYAYCADSSASESHLATCNARARLKALHEMLIAGAIAKASAADL